MNEHQPIGNLGPPPTQETLNFVARSIERGFIEYFHGKNLVWTKYFRLFCDGGRSRFYWVPRAHRINYDKHWGLYGFSIYWLGREFNFSFGEDRKGLYGKASTFKRGKKSA